jgi:glycosyltransferase involved in cell wall biosynthesis
VTTDLVASVVISTHNRAHYLAEGLKSLAAQQCRVPFEVIVVDNGSTDDTAKVLEAWTQTDSRFRRLFEPRLGLSYGKNAGIRNARAPLILFTDDDTIVDANWVQSYADLFARRAHEEIVAGGAQLPIPHDLGSWPAWFDERAAAELGLLHYGEERELQSPDYVWGANMAVPRRLFDRVGLWNESVGRAGGHRGTFEDTEFQDRVRAARGAVWFCPTAIVSHRIERRTITPRRLTDNAFSRGRNSFWMDARPPAGDTARVPKRNAVAVLVRLTAAVLQWAWWTTAFRIRADRRFLENARQAAFRSGRTLDSLRAGRRSMRLYRAVGRLAFGARHFLVRSTPDAA